MTELSFLEGTAKFWGDLKKMVAEWRAGKKKPQKRGDGQLDGHRTPIRFITHVPYSTYTIRTYGADSYDYDGDSRSSQEYAVMVDGEEPIAVSIMRYESKGNHKQMVSFVGDSVEGGIKLVLDGNETTTISMAASTLTNAYLTAKLEALPNIGYGNINVSVWPGRWLIEFVNDLAGRTFDLFEVDKPTDSVFEVHVYETKWADTREDAEVVYPIPLVGEYDGDDNVINDAVAAGSFGTAKWFPGVGWVVDVNECRDFNGDGTPEL
jgi:hypothetical protein